MALLYILLVVLVLLALLVRHVLDVKLFSGVCHSKRRLDGKTVIITGGNVGLGYETAVDLAKRGARVIIACRNETKGLRAERQIRDEAKSENVFYQHLDLSSLNSVREFSQHINDSDERVDILINNAGVMACPLTYSEDGYEMQFATNHLGHFLLTNLLLDKLKQSPQGRIVVVSSLAAKCTLKFNFDNVTPKDNRDYMGQLVYCQTKLANVLFTIHLADLLKESRVTCNCLHPGSVDTELGRHIVAKSREYRFLSPMVPMLVKLVTFFIKNTKLGAQTQIYCAVSEELDGVSGKYFSDCTQGSFKWDWNKKNAKRLWEMSERMVEEKSS